MITKVQHTSTARRIQPYKVHMVHAALKSPVNPITTYSYQSLLNKQQAWQKDASSFLFTYYTLATELSETNGQLQSSKKNATMNVRRTTSSDPTAVTAKASNKAEQASYKIEPLQLATKQVNESVSLANDQPTNVQTGHNTFALTIDGETHEFSLFAFPADTNEQILTRIAQGINSEKFGVSATVIQDKETGIQLQLESIESGTPNAFTITDLVGNTMQSLGLAQTKTKAQNALYLVNDEEHSSPSNIVNLNDKLEITLHEIGKTPVQVEVKADTAKITEQIQMFVIRMNSFHQFMKENNLQNPLPFNMTSEKIGLNQKKDGSIELDNELLTQALKENYSQVENILDQSFGQTGLDIFFPAKKPFVQNPYQSYLLPQLFYQQATATGLFFNQIF